MSLFFPFILPTLFLSNIHSVCLLRLLSRLPLRPSHIPLLDDFTLPSPLLHCLPSPASAPALPVPQLCCLASLLLLPPREPVMNAKPSLDGSADRLKNKEAQEIPPLRNYLCLTMFTCFCPAWPINIVALVFSVLVSHTMLKVWGFWTRIITG